MQTDNWGKVKKLLDDVLQIDSSERLNFLNNSGEPAIIKAEVESLIQFENQAENLMRGSAIEFSRDFFSEDNTPNNFIGQKIGVYKVIRELGYGGMGAVYLAERADGNFEQKVAIKLLKREFNTNHFRENFKRESKIQSKLNHPNIARLFDTGTTLEGIPFLVMEYIEGEAIDKYCESNKLPLQSRLKLFNKICGAVSYAHQNLVIHRDLKPSNILVTKEGIPKLLDFGISKILNNEQFEETNAFTILGAMTPEYASPEQIKGEKVTTSTDIYSLGVVLFKVLTGSLPINFTEKSNKKLFQTITECEPSIPSGILEKQRSNSVINSPQLKGDIDNIILKSLRKEPERRYQSVEQLSNDIWRFIDGQPVLARPATFFYRTNKFVQRNKISVIAGVLIFTSLVIGITLAMRQTSFAREQAQVAAESQRVAFAEAEKAKTEQIKSEKITRFMSELISYANPRWYAKGAKFGKAASVLNAIIDLGEKIDVEFANEPDIAAELHHRFTEAILGNGNIEQKARVLFHARRALELRKQFYDGKHELVAKDMVYLYWAGGIEPSEKPKYLMAAIQIMRETNPYNLNLAYMLEAYTARLMMPNTFKLHEQYRNATLPTTNENKYQIAELMLKESLPIFRHHYKNDNSAIFNAECKLSYSLAIQNKLREFDSHYVICKQYSEKSTNSDAAENARNYVGLIEKVLAEKSKIY